MRLLAALLGAAGLLITGSASAGAAHPAVRWSMTARSLPTSEVVIVQPEEISESSGLAVSSLSPERLWTINDSNNPPLVFALDSEGELAGTLRVSNVKNRDWEAIAAWRDSSGRALLAIGDIGDNAALRSLIRVELLSEPTDLDAADTTRVEPLRTIKLRYPDGAHDAETLLVDERAQRMFIVDKGLFSCTVWAVPRTHFPGTSTDDGVLERLGSLPLSLVTDGQILPDGRVLLRTYGQLAMLAPLQAGQAPRLIGTTVLPAQDQGEGLAVRSDRLLLSTEGRRQPLLSLPLAQTIAAIEPDSASPSLATSAPMESSPVVVGGSRSGSAPVLLALAGLGVAGVLAAAVLFGRRQR